MTNEKWLQARRMMELVVDLSVTPENLHIKFKQAIEKFLEDFKKSPQAQAEECSEEEDQEIDYLQNNATGNTLVHWFYAFVDYHERQFFWVCVWIINQGYIGAISDILNMGQSTHELLSRRANKLTPEQHERVKRYIDEMHTRTVLEWLEVAKTEEEIIQMFILDTIIEGVYIKNNDIEGLIHLHKTIGGKPKNY